MDAHQDRPALERPPVGQRVPATLKNGKEAVTWWNGALWWCEIGGRPRVVKWRAMSMRRNGRRRVRGEGW